MKQNRGCGCLTLLLGVLNALIIISIIVGMVQGKTSVGISLGMIAMFGCNVAVCFMAGLGSIRRAQTSTSTETGESEQVAESEGEGEDE